VFNLPFSVWRLTLAYALTMTAAPLLVLVSGIIGSDLAPHEGLATLPLALAVTGTAASTLPLGKLQRHLGRRMAFVIYASLGILVAMAAGFVVSQLLTLRTFDSILIPIPIRKLEKGVETALPAIHNGESVLVYCRQGRHRSVAMASTILIAKGYSADAAMHLVSSKREAADPYAWHIQRQIRKFEKIWNNHKNSV